MTARCLCRVITDDSGRQTRVHCLSCRAAFQAKHREIFENRRRNRELERRAQRAEGHAMLMPQAN